jgi:hypothetical protein
MSGGTGRERSPGDEPGTGPELAPGSPTAGSPAATGHPAVDAALAAVAQVSDAAPADQLAAYQAAHRTLRETLASIDDA